MLSTDKLLIKLNNFLATQHNAIKAPSELYEPINYMMQLGGKRLRPLLCLVATQMFNNNVAAALPMAAGLEFFHNFTLVHDDIMDNADIRRGKATIHHKYNTNIAILSGDLMLIKSYEYFCQTVPTKIPAILNIFNKTATQVCEGQQYDMNYETEQKVSVGEYLMMIELKTAVLIAASLQIGAIVGDATTQETEHLYQFGRYIGIAFQLQDDLLDTYGDAKKFGKKIGGDILNNKKTYLLIKALETKNEQLKAELSNWLLRKEYDAQEKIDAIIQIYNQLNIKKSTQELLNQYYKKAFQHLEQITSDTKRKEPLINIVNLLISRQV